jgi:fumarate reductase subunit D
MEYSAIALAILGVAVGVVFRLRMLLPIVALLLVVSIAFSLARGFSFLDTALTVIVAQAILQGSYFLGLVIRAIFTAAHRMRSAPLTSDLHSRLRDWKNRLLF